MFSGAAALALLASVGCGEGVHAGVGPALELATSAGDGCTRQAIYWRDNVAAWRHLELRMGGTFYAQEEQMDILGTKPRGNGLISLSQQLIAAKLNVSAGATPAGMAATFAAADALIGQQVVPPRGEGFRPPIETVQVTEALLAFNEGRVGPGDCAQPAP
jgi:hypothetical protein